jgi:hypothetical protein
MGCPRRPKWPSILFSVLAAVVLSAAISISPSGAQRLRLGAVPIPDKPHLGTLGERINTYTIAIVSGNINAAWLTIAYDLSAVLDRGDESRVLPVIWRDVDLAAQVPGRPRFDAAEEWLERNRAQQHSVGSQQDFDRFLAGRPAAYGKVSDLTTVDRERLL